METRIAQKTNGTIKLPVSLEQLAQGLRELSHVDLITLELLVDKRAMETIKKILRDTKGGKVKKLGVYR